MPGVYTMIQVFILMNSKLPQSHMRDTTITGALRAHSDKQTILLFDAEASGLHGDGHGEEPLQVSLSFVNGQIDPIKARVSSRQHLDIFITM